MSYFSRRNEKNNRIQAAFGVGASARFKKTEDHFTGISLKDWHPDKFKSDEEKARRLEKKARLLRLIHFPSKCTPETQAQSLKIYSVSRLQNRPTFNTGQTLHLIFGWQRFRVLRSSPQYHLNLSTQTLPIVFARHIYRAFIYRKVTRPSRF